MIKASANKAKTQKNTYSTGNFSSVKTSFKRLLIKSLVSEKLSYTIVKSSNLYGYSY